MDKAFTYTITKREIIAALTHGQMDMELSDELAEAVAMCMFGDYDENFNEMVRENYWYVLCEFEEGDCDD